MSLEKKMPVIFVGHGSPMNAIEDNIFNSGWKQLGGELVKPKAILCISAHWVTDSTRITAMQFPKTIHDFYGFTDELYSREYHCPGAPELAKLTTELTTVTKSELDYKWGLDHGAWSVLLPMYPNADVPVYQLSLNQNMTPKQHYELGKELVSLRNQGVLIIGSGNIVHNLRMMNSRNEVYDWANEFDTHVKSAIDKADHQSIIGYESLGVMSKYSVPTSEHFLPLLYVMSLVGEGESIEYFNEGFDYGSISMRSVVFGK